ncbi:MAG: TldD/PmbA family protein [Bacilli bacterium]|jgi:TldD protein|nr:TldD/PmbA family protein [Bacilli bacterium]
MIISKKLAFIILDEALKTGAEFADLFVQDELKHNISLSHKRVDADVFKEIFGAGLRIIKKGQVVYGYSSDLSKKSLLNLADTLSSSFQGERVKNAAALKTVHNPHKHQPKIPHTQMTDEAKIAELKKGEEAIYAYSPLIVNAEVGLLEDDSHVEIYNTNGRAVSDDRIRTRLRITSIASKDGQFQVGSEAPGASIGDEIFQMYDLVKLAKKAAKTSVDLLSAPECPSGKMTVIIGNKFGGVLFHESCGHPLEGVAISHRSSVFTGKLGQKIASDVVTAIDDGTIPNGWGSSNFDDEGEKTTRNVLIKDGVLVNYMVDNYNGARLNMKSTGACRRESYKYLATTRMTNTFIDNGKSTPEEIIKATPFGLYCVSFNGGSVDPATDQFNFTASEAYIIKDGKIDHLVKGASLIGYGYEILPNIDMVANDCDRGEGMCGASSGSIPADVGQPTVRVLNVTVGGRGGNI